MLGTPVLGNGKLDQKYKIKKESHMPLTSLIKNTVISKIRIQIKQSIAMDEFEPNTALWRFDSQIWIETRHKGLGSKLVTNLSIRPNVNNFVL